MRIFLPFIFLIFLFSCDTRGLKSDLHLIEDVSLSIPEPSGITVANNELIIVSDRNGTIYTTNLEGNVITKKNTSLHDLEGITSINNNTYAIVDEEDRQLVIVSDAKIEKIQIKGENQNNNGLEGVAYNPIDNTFWIVQEKSPVKLINVDRFGAVLKEFIVEFASDFSGICFHQNTNTLWVLSDEKQHVFQVSLEGELLNSYKIPVFKAEGIAIANDKIYIVSDAYNKLYIFKMPKLQ